MSSSPPNPWWTVRNWWNAALISRHTMVISLLGSLQNHRLCALGMPLFNHSHQRRLETIGRSGRHLEENSQNQRFEFQANVCKTTKWNEILWKTGMFPLFDYKTCAMHVTMRRDWTVTGPVRELAFPWMIAEKFSRLCVKVESISRMWIQSCLPLNSWTGFEFLVLSEAKVPVPTRLTSWLCRLVGTSS